MLARAYCEIRGAQHLWCPRGIGGAVFVGGRDALTLGAIQKRRCLVSFPHARQRALIMAGAIRGFACVDYCFERDKWLEFSRLVEFVKRLSFGADLDTVQTRIYWLTKCEIQCQSDYTKGGLSSKCYLAQKRLALRCKLLYIKMKEIERLRNTMYRTANIISTCFPMEISNVLIQRIADEALSCLKGKARYS